MNWLDRVIGFLSPTAGARRVRARVLQRTYGDILARKYEGAAKTKRIENWATSGSSANTEISSAIVTLRDRSRDLVRNNPYASRAITAIASNTVGTGIMPQATGRDARVKLAMDAWQRWGETTQCDSEGNLDFYGLQALVARTVAESGECLIRRRRRTSADGLTVPLQLQVLEADYIDSSKDGDLENGNYIIQGVEFDKQGRRVAYYLFTSHPGDRRGDRKTIRVDAADIRPVFRKDRPGQLHGVPWAAPVILRLRDFDEYEDAQLVRQKISACYTAFIQDMETPVDLDSAQSQLGEKLEPGTIELLPPGKTVTFASPPAVTGYGEYSSAVLHAVAAGFGVTYETLTGDYSQVNFSSGRMGWLEFQRNIELWRWQMLIPQMCVPVWDWFIEAATLQGINVKGVTATWTPPRREMIDPVREVNATVTAVRSGLTSLSQAIRENGYDPREHLKQIQDDNKLIDELGLVLDSDPRRSTKAGMIQVEQPTSEGDNETK